METFQIPKHNVVKTTSSFLFAFGLSMAAFFGSLLVYTVLNHNVPGIYARRNRMQNGIRHWLLWPVDFWDAKIEDVKERNGIDSYCFVRFLQVIARILFPVWLLSWIILLPVDAAFAKGIRGNSGLDLLTFANVAEKIRFSAHTTLEIFVTLWILWNIHYELVKFKPVRQRFLYETQQQNPVQANTIVVRDIPKEYSNDAALTDLYSHLVGGIRTIWFHRNCANLDRLSKRREEAKRVLEFACTDFIMRENAIEDQSSKASLPKSFNSSKGSSFNEGFFHRRPRHRIPISFRYISIPFLGDSVDTIEWACNEITRTTDLLQNSKHSRTPEVPTYALPFRPSITAFITFNNPKDAHLALETDPFTVSSQYVQVPPEDIIYHNLTSHPYRCIFGNLATFVLACMWILPCASIGALSGLEDLSVTLEWLHWVDRLPRAIIDFAQGVLPSILLTLLMMSLPFFLKMIAVHCNGEWKKTDIELALMDTYFTFQVIFSFLVVAISSGIVQAAASAIQNPESLPVILAQNLPKASTFFLTYVVLNGIAGISIGLLQPITLLKRYYNLHLRRRALTPHSMFNILYGPLSVSYGTIFPNMTLLLLITLAYSIISPIINGLACPIFFVLYQVYKFKFIHVYEQKPGKDTGGMYFMKAMQWHLFAGLYFQQVCLGALFFLADAVAEGFVVVALVMLTIFAHRCINRKFKILSMYKPLSLSGPLALRSALGQGTFQVQSYAHPASQAVVDDSIWLPRDEIGLSYAIQEELTMRGVKVSISKARIDEEGVLKVGEPVRTSIPRFEIV